MDIDFLFIEIVNVDVIRGMRVRNKERYWDTLKTRKDKILAIFLIIFLSGYLGLLCTLLCRWVLGERWIVNIVVGIVITLGLSYYNLLILMIMIE